MKMLLMAYSNIFTKTILINEVAHLREGGWDGGRYKEDTWEVYMREYDEAIREIVDNVAQGVKHEHWTIISFPRLKKIWTDYVRLGFVRDTQGMDDIKDICVRNTAKLEANTVMVGHTSQHPQDIVDEAGYKFKEPEPEHPEGYEPPEPTDPRQYKIKYRDNGGKFWGAQKSAELPKQNKRREQEYDDRRQLDLTEEEFFDRLYEYIGDETYSDYATQPLVKLAHELIGLTDPTQQLLVCDQMFNIVHMRGDIAALFVEGGSKALSELSGEHTKDAYFPEGSHKSKYVNESRDRSTLRRQVEETICNTIAAFAKDMNGRQQWEVVPFEAWARVRSGFLKYGFVRDPNALFDITDILTTNVVQLVANTLIAQSYGGSGDDWDNVSHLNNSSYSNLISQCIDRYGVDDDELALFWDYIKDEHNLARLSDTASGLLYSNVEDLNEPQKPEEQIVIIDHIFDISHPRSDLSSWLIQGGKDSLSKLTS